MPDAKSICNLGLGKIAAPRVNSLSPPKSPIERHCADGYPTWRDGELEKRIWRFALSSKVLTKTGPDVDELGDGRKYKYALPNDCIRPIRNKFTEWEQRGLFLYSRYDTLTIPYVRRASETEFPSTFVEVLACRVGLESVEFVTQSNTKDQTIEGKYARAINDAARVNAFVVGPEDVRLADENSEWITSRW